MNRYSDLAPTFGTPEERRGSVLVLRGTGPNFWHHYPFLRRFSTDQLNEFRQIYGVSGGGMCAWLYGVRDLCDFEAWPHEFGEIAKKTLSDRSLASRFMSLVRGEHVYKTKTLLDVVDSYMSPASMRLDFESFALRNFTAVSWDVHTRHVRLATRDSSPSARVSETVIAGACPERIAGISFCRPLAESGPAIADIDFAPVEVRRRFRDELDRLHPTETVIHLNLLSAKSRGRHLYVKVGNDRWPRLGQIWDFATAAFGVASTRYEMAFKG